MALHVTLDQINLVDPYRTFHPQPPDSIFFSSARGTILRIHRLGYKTSLNIQCKKMEIISSIYSDNNSMKVEINYRKKIGKMTC